MKKLILTLSFLLLVFGSLTTSVDAKVRVRGYTTKKGTYVAPHFRQNPNKTKLDNWSTVGNVNPYTGKKGHKKLR
jgi:drug/metabolite transporter superfamily protein YnfA